MIEYDNEVNRCSAGEELYLYIPTVSVHLKVPTNMRASVA